MADTSFSLSDGDLRALVTQSLDIAREMGASAAEADLSESFGQSVTVRMREVETIEYTRDKDFGVTVYFGKQRGHASSSDLSPAAIRRTVEAACTIARYTAADEFAGLADPELLARGPLPDLDLYHPASFDIEAAIERARACEDVAMAVDPRIDNSDGATVGTHEGQYAYGNTLGFLETGLGTHHSLSCAVIATSGDEMERDYWYTTARDVADLETYTFVGRRAGERTVRRLGARKLKTVQAPILFEAPAASSILGHLVSAASGSNLYRKATFLLDAAGTQVFSPVTRVLERPHLKRGLSSANFDAEGVRTLDRDVVAGGVLEGYFLGSYSARKLGLRSTGNAGGAHNLIMVDTGQDFPALLRQMGRGLVVTELLGFGVNMVTGDYSRGAAGFWVEDGEIAHAVSEVTIAGNLKDMFRGIVAVGNDVVVQGSRQTGSVLIDQMTIAGD